MAVVETTAAELTPELLDLFEHEKVIEQGLASFIEVGNALLAIKADRKYRHAGFATFEDYCQQRWNISRAYGHRLTNAAAITESLARALPEMSPRGDIPLPQTEKQVRPLTAVPEPERAEAWVEAVEEAGGEQPTAKQVQAVVERRKPQPVPKKVPQPVEPVADETSIRPHPATYPQAVLDVFEDIIPSGSTVLDPFGGIGGIHRLDRDTFAIEIEPEWAQIDPRTTLGDARNIAALFPGRLFDVIATSPAYGNRLADAFYNAADPEARHSYALDLGRPLTAGNGAGLHFDTDGEYERLHEEVWAAAVGALREGGLFLLNCKDFARDGKIMPVTGWHVGTLTDLGLRAIDLRTIPVAGLSHTTAAKLSELVVVFEKPWASS